MRRNLGCTQARSKSPVVELVDGDGGGLVSAGLPEATTTRGSTTAANTGCAAGHHHAAQTRYGGDETA